MLLTPENYAPNLPEASDKASRLVAEINAHKAAEVAARKAANVARQDLRQVIARNWVRSEAKALTVRLFYASKGAKS